MRFERHFISILWITHLIQLIFYVSYFSGEGGINSQEIISDMSLLKGLAQLQESMEWFSVRILQFASDLRHEPSLSPNNGSGDKPPPVSGPTLQNLTSIGQDFDELANTCLLVLHLEVSY